MMSCCEERTSQIDLYLDDELRGDELETFNRHVRECGSCRKELVDRQRFLEQVRAAGPLYAPSPKFRTEMARLLAASATSPGSADLLGARQLAALVGGPLRSRRCVFDGQARIVSRISCSAARSRRSR